MNCFAGTTVTKIIFPMSITLSLTFDSGINNFIPSECYPIDGRASISGLNNYYETPTFKSNDQLNFEVINSFANKLLSDQEDMPAEFAEVIKNDFWDLLL